MSEYKRNLGLKMDTCEILSLIVYYYGSGSSSYCHDYARITKQKKDCNAAEKQTWL